jgi:hypothetical protein
MTTQARLPSPPATGYQADLWGTLLDLMVIIAKQRTLDPVTTELVRLRGARRHNCRMCQSRRTISALEAGASETTFQQIDFYETSDLSERHKVALRFTDALITRPSEISAELADELRRFFEPAEVAEIMADVLRNSCQKVAVAFAQDDAVVSEGIEYYDVGADGHIVFPDPSGPTTSWPVKTPVPAE